MRDCPAGLCFKYILDRNQVKYTVVLDYNQINEYIDLVELMVMHLNYNINKYVKNDIV